MDRLELPAGLSAKLDEFSSRLKTVYGDGLISIVLYGSASGGDFADNRSNINIMIVLDDTSLANLSRAYPVITLKRFRAISPVFFTESFINNSLDVFPIEFLDIKENHRLLYGKDIVSGLAIDNKNLRFQCEHELKSKLIELRRRYTLTANRRDLERLLFKAFTSTLHILRNLLRLKSIEPPYSKAEILEACEKAFGIDTACLNRVFWAKTKKMVLDSKDIDSLLSGLTEELEAISSVADKL